VAKLAVGGELGEAELGDELGVEPGDIALARGVDEGRGRAGQR